MTGAAPPVWRPPDKTGVGAQGDHVSGLRRLALSLSVCGLLPALALAEAQAQSRARPPSAPAAAPAQEQAPPQQGSSRGENFSAKPPAQLFASDCTGSGCHRGPQGLAKDRGQFGLASFLREHYTNSRESAAALAAYLSGFPSDPRGARQQPDPRQPRSAARPDAPKPPEPPATAVRPGQPPADPGDIVRPEATRPGAPPARTVRGRPGPQQTTAAPPPAAAPEPPPPAPPAPPEPPKPQVFDIFD
jgi:hypothetical protein